MALAGARVLRRGGCSSTTSSWLRGSTRPRWSTPRRRRRPGCGSGCASPARRRSAKPWPRVGAEPCGAALPCNGARTAPCLAIFRCPLFAIRNDTLEAPSPVIRDSLFAVTLPRLRSPPPVISNHVSPSPFAMAVPPWSWALPFAILRRSLSPRAPARPRASLRHRVLAAAQRPGRLRVPRHAAAGATRRHAAAHGAEWCVPLPLLSSRWTVHSAVAAAAAAASLSSCKS